MRRRLLLLTSLLSATALASVSDPFPGVRLVRNSGSAMVIVHLCTPGVAVRATKYDERRGTPQAWAQRVGAQVAINADFFDFRWSLVNGRARGGGEDWPADRQFFESRSYWFFGLFTAGLQENADVPPAAPPWMTEIVGGHNQLIGGGQSLGPAFDGDAVLAGAHRRTAIGLSADRRTLFLMASNKLLTGAGLVAELFALQAEAGGPGIDVATNVDGGGSSQLYVEGQGQLITSGREVNNHLGVFAGGDGFPANCNNLPPRGALDSASCDGVSGWSQDLTTPDTPNSVRLDFGLPDPVTVVADQHRPDLCGAIMSCSHGFTAPLPRSLMDGQPHAVRAHGLDLENGSAWALGDGPTTFTCDAQPPGGVLRHVPDPAAFAAWRFDFARDVQPVSEVLVSGREQGTPWPRQVELIQAEGRPEVYVLDGVLRRHVPDPAAFAAWRFDAATIRLVPATELASYREGPRLPLPWLVKGAGDAIYVVDTPPLPALVPELQVITLAAQPERGGAAQPGGVVGGCSVGATPLLGLALLGLRRARRRRNALSRRTCCSGAREGG